MFHRQLPAAFLAALLALAPSLSLAQDDFTAPSNPEEALALRKALMREDGSILRSAARLTGAEAVAAARTIADNYSHIPALFPEGSIVGDSKALPAIWENWETFTGIAETGQQAAEAAFAAAQAGDDAGYQAALKTVMGTCGQCHQQFRS